LLVWRPYPIHPHGAGTSPRAIDRHHVSGVAPLNYERCALRFSIRSNRRTNANKEETRRGLRRIPFTQYSRRTGRTAFDYKWSRVVKICLCRRASNICAPVQADFRAIQNLRSSGPGSDVERKYGPWNTTAQTWQAHILKLSNISNTYIVPEPYRLLCDCDQRGGSE
jgi:hypothetical protein